MNRETETNPLEDYPSSGTPGERLLHALACAILAPSAHNTQPWLFRVHGSSVDVIADRSRALPVVDPEDRELLISCGAALHHLLVALAGFGERARVEFLPDDTDPDWLATVTLEAHGEVDARARRRLEVMPRRRTTRFTFDPQEPPPDTVQALKQAAADEGAALYVADAAQKRALAELIAEADRRQLSDKAFRRELAAWVHPNRARYRDGMPGYAHGLGDLASSFGPLVLRTFDLGRNLAAKDQDLAERSPLLVVLATDDDRALSRLKAGAALSALLLEATYADLSASFLNQPIEVPALRTEVARVIGLNPPATPQLILRLGYYTGKPLQATPRRSVAEVLV